MDNHNHPEASSSRPGQISKAAFFRAKSPPNEAAHDRRVNALKSGWQFPPEAQGSSEGSEDDYGEEEEDRRLSIPSLSPSHGATVGHSPQIPQVPNGSRVLPTPLERGISQRSYNGSMEEQPSGSLGSMGGGGQSTNAYVPNAPARARSRLGESGHRRTMSEIKRLPKPPASAPASSTPDAGFNRDPNELLMTLLAGQAAMDCQGMPVYRWEEVEEWKKELNMLSSRLAAQVAKHQREQKILTAAKTLAKLNVGNKRMSKQTVESVEVAEQKAADAEKEMLVLRDRESGLRRRLMEHWAGVMAWEVRRLEFVVKSAEDRALQAAQEVQELSGLRDIARKADMLENKLDSAHQQLESGSKKIREYEEEAQMLKSELNSRDSKVSDLEGALADLEDEVKMKRKECGLLEAEIGQHRTRADEYENMLKGVDTQAGARVEELESELSRADEERKQWNQERAHLRESAEDGKMKANMWETAKLSAAQALGVAQVENVVDISDGIKKLMGTVRDRDDELKVIKEEMREISLGFEDEIGRLARERDGFRAKAEEMGGRSLDEETVRVKQTEQLETKLRAQSDRLMILENENSSIKRALHEAETAISQQKSALAVTAASSDQAAKIVTLRRELDSHDALMEELWALLPVTHARLHTGLVDRSTNRLKDQVVSPSVDIDFEALRTLYSSSPHPNEERYSGPEHIVNKIKMLMEDGQVLVERVIRSGKERELLKSNALRAQKLVEEGQANLKTYQRQVDMLESRLKASASGGSTSELQGQLAEAREAVIESRRANQRLEQDLALRHERIERLSEANDILSQRALTLADEMEQEKRVAHAKLEKEIESLRKQLKASDERVDDERAREQTQRIQLLDELNSLQSEVTRLRAQLR